MHGVTQVIGILKCLPSETDPEIALKDVVDKN
jgi:hypothetical protein